MRAFGETRITGMEREVMAQKVLVVYYSATGTTYKMAQEAIDSNKGWAAHHLETQNVEEATLADLEWADAIIFGAPTRYGMPAAQLKQFIDQTGPLWAKGALVNKIVSSFTSAATAHGGQETTILALNNTFYHWGSIIVPPGYADPIQFQAGNPYGASFVSNNGQLAPDDTALASCRFQGKRVAEVAGMFVKEMEFVHHHN
jgi:NAD(P)H dehydrogenase (quinone)